MIAPKVIVQSDDFDQSAETRKLTRGRTDIGAVATFTGLCRSEDHSLTALELEHYPGMAEAEIERSASEACQRWPIDGMTVIHRYGVIRPGEQIVLVIATSRHRDAAFDGARYVMDFLKTNAPFWKKEHRADGTPGDWVDAKESDEAAKKRWD
ncbi:MAG: molybdopterin synthase catalytic subunit [Rhizobiaceae bacterium]|nr:molybdopterin synthase catalytic subunit [Rhizobiaceae bacterium]